MILTHESGSQEDQFDEKKWRQKISWDYPFKTFIVQMFQKLRPFKFVADFFTKIPASLSEAHLQYSIYSRPQKKRHQLKNRRFLKYFFTGITYTVQCKKRPKPFPIEPVLRKNFLFNLYCNSGDVVFVSVGLKRPHIYFLENCL
jgi:hypothetical protein